MARQGIVPAGPIAVYINESTTQQAIVPAGPVYINETATVVPPPALVANFYPQFDQSVRTRPTETAFNTFVFPAAAAAAAPAVPTFDRLFDAPRARAAPVSWNDIPVPAAVKYFVFDRFELPPRLPRPIVWDTITIPTVSVLATGTVQVPFFEPGARLKANQIGRGPPQHDQGALPTPPVFAIAGLIGNVFDPPLRLRSQQPVPTPVRDDFGTGPYRTPPAVPVTGFIGNVFDPALRPRGQQPVPTPVRDDYGTGPYRAPPIVPITGFIGAVFDPPLRLSGAIGAATHRDIQQVFGWTFAPPIHRLPQQITDTTILQLPIDAVLEDEQNMEVSARTWDILPLNPKYKVQVSAGSVHRLSEEKPSFTVTTSKKGYD